MSKVSGVHLVGSVPLDSAASVFKTVSDLLPGRMRRIPDGETGERYVFIAIQNQIIAETPGIVSVEPEPGAWAPLPVYGLAPGMKGSDVDFGNLKFADAAIESFQIFDAMQKDGTIPQGVRFQVSLYLPLEVTYSYMLRDFAELEPRYEEAYHREVDRIFSSIPHEKLAIQFDVVGSLMAVKGFPGPFPDPLDAVVSRIARYVSWVPANTEVGFHFCYGDWGQGRVTDASDTTAVTTLANALFDRIERQVNWIHLPVPPEHDDDAYFEPLKSLKRPQGTEIYLGLMNVADGAEGARRRIAAASKVFDEFGVGTPCGMGRLKDRGVDRTKLEDLLAAHASVAEPIDRRV